MSDEMGFHSAMVRSHGCMASVGTNALETKVNGNSTENMNPLTASTERSHEPIITPNQIIANPNTSTSTKPSAPSHTDVVIRQPMMTPVSAITTMPIDECSRLAMLRPISTDDRRMGSDRKRSMMPFSMSAVMPVATMNAVNTIV